MYQSVRASARVARARIALRDGDAGENAYRGADSSTARAGAAPYDVVKRGCTVRTMQRQLSDLRRTV